MKITAVIVAGGRGTRMGAGKNKVFLKILGEEVICHTLRAFENNNFIDDIIVVTGKNDITECAALVKKYKFSKVSTVTEGGETRRESVFNGLMCASGDIVLIHDGARALVTDSEINNSIEDCKKYGASAAGVKCKDTLKAADAEGFISGTVNRKSTYLIQTPQTFYLDKILDLHKRADRESFNATDDCMIAERYGMKVKISAGSYDNIKLTTPEDMIIGERILKRRKENGI
ncbi:MAG: 2-C-methyl-D-erythritol 4-phosphate cytidylyltransferase [Firmicutes bacterium]|nr:2-C-methyl-D-erythritol 4-phosphate cytidylyltransferase [Bacillota bacterium]